ncbi:cyclopropane-fatty-acyl-phospholipid synthase family protein [Pelagibacteraceae bacterium]|nr:cyclopropane-fatty-acyl-phospholipid synthase family protein [Pelagibacteraceae bacterium]
MYLLPKFLSKIIKEDGFILISPAGQKFLIGNPKKNKPLEVKASKNISELKCTLHPEKWFPEYMISKDFTFANGSLEDFITILINNKGRGNINFFNEIISSAKSIYRRLFFFDTRSRNKKSIGFHYDTPLREVYSYMLGESMMYSCAYWNKESEKQTLTEAQYEKINFLKNKLRLNKFDTLLDIGCGNGTFLLKVAEEHNIRMHGVSLSEEQTKVAKERQKEKNLDNADITFEVKDFKDIKDKKYSKIISIGQFEHQDSKHYKDYFKKIYELLTENGIAVIHYIGSNTGPRPENDFIQKYIFPFGRCCSLSEVVPEIEKSGLILSDIDIWRKHYYLTLLEWHKNFMNKRDRIAKLMGEKFTTIYRIYLWGCAQSFLNDLEVIQLTLTKKMDTVPITKKYLFN